MSHFRPKEVLQRAQQSEKEGHGRQAANDYALLSAYLRKKKKFTDAQSMVSKAIQLAPDSGRLFLEQALCFWGVGDESQAHASVERCVQIGIEKKQLQTYLAHLQRDFVGLNLLQKKFFDTWLSLDRTQLTPFLGLAELHFESGQMDLAKECILSGLRIEPTDQRLLELLEAVLEKSNKGLEGEYVQRFKKQKISLSQLLLLLGEKESVVSSSQNSPVKVAPSLGKSDELKDLSELVADLEKELELEIEEKFENVEPLIQEFIRKSNVVIGSDLKARLDLAYAFFEMGRYREAKMELGLIENEHVLYGQAQYLLGTILLKEGSDVASLGAFQTALRTAVKGTYFWKETSYQLAKIHIRLGDSVHAQKYLEQIEKVDPDYREIRALRKSVSTKASE